MSQRLAYNPDYALNAICPYYTMFPLEYPFRILKNYKNSEPIILDPFCGRGTTIFAAREMGFSAWGIDTSPIAVAIAQAKLASAKKEEILALAKRLISNPADHVPTTTFFKKAFAPSTLRELCALREGLLRIRVENDNAILLRAAALGCLHGPLNRTKEGAAYFSNQMPRTFSTKPDYSVRYWKERDMKAPEVSVLKVLEKKLARIVRIDDERVGTPEQILCSDSCAAHTYDYIPTDVSLVITSPPYYGMRTYVQDQWLRAWFLGGPEELCYENDDQIDHNGQDAFINDLASVWSNISNRSNSDDLRLYVRLGSIPSKECNPKTIFASSLEEAGHWRLVSVRNAKTAHAGKRQADQMVSNSQATLEYDFHAVRL